MPNKVLIVEDDDAIRKVYVDTLKRHGFDVLEASGGNDALKVVKDSEPDLILLDMMMPNGNGQEFLEAYQPRQKHPAVKVVILSNIEEPFYKAMELGAIDYIVKSDIGAKELVDFVKRTLE